MDIFLADLPEPERCLQQDVRLGPQNKLSERTITPILLPRAWNPGSVKL